MRLQIQLMTRLAKLEEVEGTAVRDTFRLLVDDAAPVRHAAAELVADLLPDFGERQLQVDVDADNLLLSQAPCALASRTAAVSNAPPHDRNSTDNLHSLQRDALPRISKPSNAFFGTHSQSRRASGRLRRPSPATGTCSCPACCTSCTSSRMTRCGAPGG